MNRFGLVDLTIIVLYVLAITAWGAWLGRNQKDAHDYFLAEKSLPWWAICFSIVATETSVLTFISVPATAYTSDMWMVQLALGYLIGRIGVAAILLPGYFRGDITTAYALLERRFGPQTRRFASTTFIVTRVLGSSVRLFATAIPIKLITGLPYWEAIVLTGTVTLIYTYFGGLRAVVWVDVLQMFMYLAGAAISLVVLIRLVPGGWQGIREAAWPAAKFHVLHFDGGFKSASWVLTGLVGGAFLSMASHGVDQLIVQRLLAAPTLREARKALIGSGILIVGQFTLFLVVGVALYAYYHGKSFTLPDEIFPTFIVNGLPAGVSGIVVAGIFSVAMSSEASAINSLASAMTQDIYAPLAHVTDPAELMRAGKRSTLIAGLILVLGAILFQFVQQGTPIVVIALGIASFTYGGLLGGFLLGILSKRAEQRDAIFGMSLAIIVMFALWAAQQFGVTPRLIDPLWFTLVGSIITVAAGSVSARLRGAKGGLVSAAQTIVPPPQPGIGPFTPEG